MNINEPVTMEDDLRTQITQLSERVGQLEREIIQCHRRRETLREVLAALIASSNGVVLQR